MSKNIAENACPKKPLTGYFQFQVDKRRQEPGIQMRQIKAAWEALGEAGKKKFNDAFSQKFEVFKKEKAAWEERYGVEEKPKGKKENKEISKTEKEKGGIARRSKDKKVEQETPKKVSKSKEKSKAEKGKSKGKSKK